MNCSFLSEIILSDSLYNLYTLSLNSLASPSANIFSIVEIKWTIFVNLFTTTKIELYFWANSNLVIKSAEICVQGLFGIELGINLSTGYFVWFLFLWQKSYSSIYCFISLVTSSYQIFLVTSSTVFHYPPCPSTSES